MFGGGEGALRSLLDDARAIFNRVDIGSTISFGAASGIKKGPSDEGEIHLFIEAPFTVSETP